MVLPRFLAVCQTSVCLVKLSDQAARGDENSPCTRVSTPNASGAAFPQLRSQQHSGEAAGSWKQPSVYRHTNEHFISQCLPSPGCHNTRLSQLERGLARSSVRPTRRTDAAESGRAWGCRALLGWLGPFRCRAVVAALCFVAT